MVVLVGPAAEFPTICRGHRLLPKRVCLEAGQGMVFHQLLSLDGVGLAQVSWEWQCMGDLSDGP
jgi:hypothetical protein